MMAYTLIGDAMARNTGGAMSIYKKCKMYNITVIICQIHCNIFFFHLYWIITTDPL